MEFDIVKSSNKISELDININNGDFSIDLLHLTLMIRNQGESGYFKRHKHSSCEIQYVAEGKFVVVLDDYEFEANKGDFYIIAPGVYHKHVWEDTGILKKYIVNFDVNIVNRNSIEAYSLVEIMNKALCRPRKEKDGEISEIFYKILREANYKQLGYYNQIKSLFSSLILKTARAESESNNILAPVFPKNEKEDLLFSKIEEYIEDNLRTSISPKDIAMHLYLSDKQLRHIIMKKRKTSTKVFINFLRLKRAKELLRNPDLSVKEVSEALGFSDIHYFSQFFKREEGCSPVIFKMITAKR